MVPKTGGGLNITMSSMVVVTCLTWITGLPNFYT